MICSGRDAATGEFVEIEFDESIRSVRRVKPEGANADAWVAPGFIDIQVNGFAGVDFNRPDTPHNEIRKALDLIVSTGVTRCLPTVITGPKDDIVGCLRNLAAAKNALPLGKVIAGFHVEGPHIASVDGPRGAHPLDSVRPPDIEEYKRWQEATEGQIRLITLSAEYESAPDYIRRIVRDGVTASIGHTAATSDQIRAAVDAGATLSTHLGNAAHSVMPKHPNYIWDQMADDRLSASFIVDGIHLGAAFLKSAVRAKTVSRSVLVTDASAPAGAKPGRYVLGRQAADLTEDGRVVLAGTDRLAGSALKMNDAIANVMRMAGISLSEALAMATTHPARVAHLEGRSNWLVVGERADLVTFRTGTGVTIDSVYIDGKRAV
ncbi:MAG TPA: amidohydrolase family protein [Bryobacteraceae bacterium]|nr:amidohydrolase family protein [Bryobacteraceae bacterium]